MDNQHHSNNIEAGSIPATCPCIKCGGAGICMYGSTATWYPCVIAGQAMTEDICNLCWGSGDENHPGPNLLMKFKERNLNERH